MSFLWRIRQEKHALRMDSILFKHAFICNPKTPIATILCLLKVCLRIVVRCTTQRPNRNNFVSPHGQLHVHLLYAERYIHHGSCLLADVLDMSSLYIDGL
jgi:hypothetical protein